MWSSENAKVIEEEIMLASACSVLPEFNFSAA
jgi:hypothetical protein